MCTSDIIICQAVAPTHPVDEEGLDELDDLQRDQQTDGDQVVEEDDEGEEVEAKVSRATICWGLGGGGGEHWTKGSDARDTRQRRLTKVSELNENAQSLFPANDQHFPKPEAV